VTRVSLNVRSMAVPRRAVASSSRNVNPQGPDFKDWGVLMGRPFFYVLGIDL